MKTNFMEAYRNIMNCMKELNGIIAKVIINSDKFPDEVKKRIAMTRNENC